MSEAHARRDEERLPAALVGDERPSRIPRWRALVGWMLALVGTPALALGLLAVRRETGLPSILMLFLALVVGVAAVGGIWPSLLTAVGSVLLVNWFYTPPFHTLAIRDLHNVLALAVFVTVAAIVSTLVSVAARRSSQALRARAEADLISRTAITLIGSHDPLNELLTLLRSAFALNAVAILSPSSSGWRVVAHSGTPCPASPQRADHRHSLSNGAYLCMMGAIHRGHARVLDAFGSQLVSAMRQRELHAEASAARSAVEANELRGALLAAVSHDLRTPLSSIKASVTSLLQEEVTFSPDETRDFLRMIDAETDRLNVLVGNLLDMSRLRAGNLRPTMREVSIEEVVGVSLAGLGERARMVVVDVPESLPVVRADFALLERSLANLVDNALVHAAGATVHVQGGRSDAGLTVAVVDRGRGIPPEDRDRAFEPFQRLDGGAKRSGVGLGLAVARGFVDAMGGHLVLDETPGGGLTARIELPVSA